MRVTFNAFPDTLLGRLQSLGSEQNKSLTQLSTGQRISAPSDDAPAMQRILNLRTEKKQNQQFHRNATDGLERSKVTFSTLEQLKDLLVRSSELAANLSGASSDQEYKAKAAEIDQLIQQGVNLGNTKLRGSYLFSGESSEVVPFKTETIASGRITSVGYNGSANESLMHIGEGKSMTLAVSATAQENGDVAGILNEMIRLRDAMSEFNISKVQNVRTSGGNKTNFVDPLGSPQSFVEIPQVYGLKYDLGYTSIPLVGDPPYIEPEPQPTSFIQVGNSPSLSVGDKIQLDLAQGEGQGLDSGNYYIVGKLGNFVELSKTQGGEPIDFTTAISPSSKISKFEGIEYPSVKIKLPSGHELVNGDKIKLDLFDGEGAPLVFDGKYFIKSIDENGYAEISETENGPSILINEPLSSDSKFREIRIEYPNDRTLLPNPHDLKIGDKIKVDFADGENPQGLDSGTYYVSNIISTPKGQFLQLASIPGGPPIVFNSDITSKSNFQRVGGLQHIEDAVLSALSRQGTIQYRLENVMKDLEIRYEATEQLISKDADVDFAEATVRLNRSQMAYQAAIQSGAMIQRNSLLDYVR